MEYLTGPQVCERYAICSMTLYRWGKDEQLAFPKPMIINRRKRFKVDDLVSWERQRAKEAA